MLNHTGTVTLKTQRLILRKFTLSDIKNSYENWASDAKMLKQVDLMLNPNFDDVEQLICEIIFGYCIKKYDFCIELKQTKQIIGSVQLTDINEYMKSAEIGFLLGSRFWNNGYMSEAISAVLAHSLETVKFVRISGKCMKDNIASENVMLKNNMVYEGFLHKALKIRNEFFDCKLFSKVNDFII